MKNKKTHKGLFCVTAGALLLLAALGLTGYNLWDDARAASVSGESYAQLEEQIPKGTAVWQGTVSPEEIRYPDYVLDPTREMPTLEIDGNEYIGTLELPSLELSLPVLSEWSYPNLKLGPCRYTGSAYLNDLVIAAHDYRAHFAKILSLNIGDAVVFTDTDGNIFSYSVSELEVLKPTAVEALQTGDWALSLFTCTPAGQHRVVVRCVPAE